MYEDPQILPVGHTMNDILKKFGATPYIPGQKITVMLSVETLMIFDEIIKRKKERDG
jgi:hypothetical protein